MLEIYEIVPGKGANQIFTMKRATDTRWARSHFNSTSSLINMYESTCCVLKEKKLQRKQQNIQQVAMLIVLTIT